MESERVFSMSDFYEFSSCGYMTTFAASADEFERCLSFGDGSAGGRFYNKLILGDYKDIHMPVTYREMGYSPESSGYHFDIKTWDGSDLFITEGSRHVIASKQFIKVLVENKITACEYCSLTDYGDWSKIKRLH